MKVRNRGRAGPRPLRVGQDGKASLWSKPSSVCLGEELGKGRKGRLSLPQTKSTCRECIEKRMRLFPPPVEISGDVLLICRSWSSESQETKKEN